ncbi:unnamed protein product [Zymoseptoria tritici ST99CH_1A5]|uniref:Uncharacterized protein n=2 Tax=Zymoseptoria tritici TaxID=1047171 RepID=A0A1X7S6D1_ZYMT9|nr:unnamed protein product [Zymoseptoria tritici ST99CH_3D7]SMR63578.1 unnamed protein product [Zymoseptoria tritici ST99CH_3D1]SMY28944.1 unnamed protein product [Zymoseptoria tritici ST99CH_1A5]
MHLAQLMVMLGLAASALATAGYTCKVATNPDSAGTCSTSGGREHRHMPLSLHRTNKHAHSDMQGRNVAEVQEQAQDCMNHDVN